MPCSHDRGNGSVLAHPAAVPSLLASGIASLIDPKKGKTRCVARPVQATDDAGRRSWSDHRMLPLVTRNLYFVESYLSYKLIKFMYNTSHTTLLTHTYNMRGRSKHLH
jgi:hypothetical protein